MSFRWLPVSTGTDRSAIAQKRSRLPQRIREATEASSHVRWHQEREHPCRAGRPAGQTDRRVQRPLHPHRDVRAPLRSVPARRRGSSSVDKSPAARCASWAGSPGQCWSDRVTQHRRRTLVPWSQEPTSFCLRWRCLVPVPLDAAIRVGRPAAIAGRDGLGGLSAGSMVDDPQDRGRLRRLRSHSPAATKRSASSILDLPAPGQRRPAAEHDGQR